MSGDLLGGRYRVERELARGGMGKVLLVRDERLDREVAVKSILPGSSDDAQVRFLEEAQITGQLAHPNVVPVHELGQDGDEMFLAMKRVSGQDLRQLISSLAQEQETREEYPLGRLLRLFLKVCDAMAYAHERGVIHRDLKPANIMLGAGDEVLVMDWGLARPIGQEGSVVSQARESASVESGSGQLTQEGAVVGTPAYMPVEQADGEPLDASADTYALGATLYHLLTHQAPYSGSSLQVLHALFKGPPPRPRSLAPGIPARLEAVVLKAMSRDRTERYPDAQALAREVEAFLDGRAVSAHREGLGESIVRVARRHRLLLGTIVVAVLLVATAAGLAQAAVVSQRALADEEQARAEEAKLQAEQAATQTARAQRQARAVAGANEPIRRAAQFILRSRGPLSLSRVQKEHRQQVLVPLHGANELLAGLSPEEQSAEAVALCRANLKAARRAADRALVETLLARDPWTASAQLELLELGEERPLLEARALLRQWRRREALEILRAAGEPREASVRAASAALRLTLERAAPAEQRRAYEAAIQAVREGEPDWLHGWLFSRLGQTLARLGALGSPSDPLPTALPKTAHQAFARALRMTPHDAWIDASRVRTLVPLNHGIDARRERLSPSIDRLLDLEGRLHRVWLGPSGKPKFTASGSDKQWEVLTKRIATIRREIKAGRYRVPEFVLLRIAAEGALILGKKRDGQAAIFKKGQARLREARRLVERALEAVPDDVDTLALRAAILLRDEDLDGARAAADRALELDPEHGRANHAKGEALRRAGKVQEAKGLLELGARGSLRFERWLHLAQCLERSDEPADWERGVAAARRALELTPVMLDHCDPRVEVLAEDPELPRTLARLYERQGKQAHAALLYLRAHVFHLRTSRSWTAGEGPRLHLRDGRDLLQVARLHEALGLRREALGFLQRAQRFRRVKDDARQEIARLRLELGKR